MEPFVPRYFLERGAGAAIHNLFAHKIVGARAGGYLWHVGNRHYLPVLPERLHLLADRSEEHTSELQSPC